MDLTLGEAAKAAKRTKQALAAAVQKGRLSGTKDANGVWRVNVAELLRVYPEAQKELGDGMSGLAGLGADTAAEVRELRVKVEALEELRRTETARAEELRVERDAWKQQAERLLLALPAGKGDIHPVDAPESGNQVEVQTRKKRGFWRSIFGGIGNDEKA